MIQEYVNPLDESKQRQVLDQSKLIKQEKKSMKNKPSEEIKTQIKNNLGEITGSPIEVVFKFPRVYNTVIDQFLVTIGDDKQIQGRVMEKEKA